MKLQAAYKASGGKKVNIVSHSMGGLLVQCFMSLHADVCISSLLKFLGDKAVLLFHCFLVETENFDNLN